MTTIIGVWFIYHSAQSVHNKGDDTFGYQARAKQKEVGHIHCTQRLD